MLDLKQITTVCYEATLNIKDNVNQRCLMFLGSDINVSIVLRDWTTEVTRPLLDFDPDCILQIVKTTWAADRSDKSHDVTGAISIIDNDELNTRCVYYELKIGDEMTLEGFYHKNMASDRREGVEALIELLIKNVDVKVEAG